MSKMDLFTKQTINDLVKANISRVEIIASKYASSVFERDDLIQEGMIGLLASIDTFDKSKEASFKTYSNRCITNAILSYIRKYSRKSEIPLNALVEWKEDFLDTNMSLSSEDLYIAKETKESIEKFMSESLSKLENEVLKYRIQGFSYKDISSLLEKDEKVIDRALQRARKKLLLFLGDKD